MSFSPFPAQHISSSDFQLECEDATDRNNTIETRDRQTDRNGTIETKDAEMEQKDQPEMEKPTVVMSVDKEEDGKTDTKLDPA